MVKAIASPGLPRIILTASERVMPFTGLLSSRMIKSPANTPALNAGVSSIGETTFTKPSSILTCMPKPPNCPDVPISSSLNASLSK